MAKKLYLLFINIVSYDRCDRACIYTMRVFNLKSGCTLQFSPFPSILGVEMEERASVFHRYCSVLLPFIDCRTVLSLKSQVVSRTSVSIWEESQLHQILLMMLLVVWPLLL